jgi:hypothetical protein
MISEAKSYSKTEFMAASEVAESTCTMLDSVSVGRVWGDTEGTSGSGPAFYSKWTTQFQSICCWIPHIYVDSDERYSEPLRGAVGEVRLTCIPYVYSWLPLSFRYAISGTWMGRLGEGVLRLLTVFAIDATGLNSVCRSEVGGGWTITPSRPHISNLRYRPHNFYLTNQLSRHLVHTRVLDIWRCSSSIHILS